MSCINGSWVLRKIQHPEVSYCDIWPQVTTFTLKDCPRGQSSLPEKLEF